MSKLPGQGSETRNPFLDSALGPLWLGLWFGLVVGFAEVAVQLVRRQFGIDVDLPREFPWRTPAASAAFLAALGLATVLVRACFGRWLPTWSMVFGFALVAGYAISFLFNPELHKIAGLILAAGVAVRLASWSARANRPFDPLVRRSLGWMAGALGATAVAMQTEQSVTLRRRAARLPSPPDGSRNVLFIVMDTVRASNLGLHGYARDTSPRLDRFARDAVVFERAIATAPWTLPSHASMFTGQWPHRLSTGWQTPLDATYPTVAELLRDQGFWTVGFSANRLYASWEQGIDRGFLQYFDYTFSPGQCVMDSTLGRTAMHDKRVRERLGFRDALGRKRASDLTDEFLVWLQGHPQQRFFAFLNYFDAHSPYLPPEPYATLFADRRPDNLDLELRRTDIPSDDFERMLAAYDGGIRYIDAEIGRILDALPKWGLDDNTIVVVVGDHGEEFGEHVVFDHANSLYRPGLQVPLLIRDPQGPKQLRVTQPASIRDLAATFLDLANASSQSALPGDSLVRFYDATPSSHESTVLLSEVTRPVGPVRPFMPIAKGDMVSMVAGGLRYIRRGDGHEELYDFDRDPWETNDLATTTSGQAELPKLRDLLERTLRET